MVKDIQQLKGESTEEDVVLKEARSKAKYVIFYKKFNILFSNFRWNIKL